MKNETELKPKGIFFKMDWDEMITDLEDESVGKMIKNAYNYLNDRELIEMDKMESKLFKHVIIPVLNFNNEKYQKQVEHNRRVAPKGGRKPKTEETQINPMGIIETQNIPSGSFTNPENPKDKDRDKDKVKKVSFGMAGGGLRAKLNNPKARQAFSKRHNCPQKKDRTKASYWSCRLPRYAKLLGLKSNFSGFW
jgi:hypothetical protein